MSLECKMLALTLWTRGFTDSKEHIFIRAQLPNNLSPCSAEPLLQSNIAGDYIGELLPPVHLSKRRSFFCYKFSIAIPFWATPNPILSISKSKNTFVDLWTVFLHHFLLCTWPLAPYTRSYQSIWVSATQASLVRPCSLVLLILNSLPQFFGFAHHFPFQ